MWRCHLYLAQAEREHLPDRQHDHGQPRPYRPVRRIACRARHDCYVIWEFAENNDGGTEVSSSTTWIPSMDVSSPVSSYTSRASPRRAEPAEEIASESTAQAER